MYRYSVYETVLLVAQIKYCREVKTVKNELKSAQKEALECNLR
jgi:hypothetical protein